MSNVYRSISARKFLRLRKGFVPGSFASMLAWMKTRQDPIHLGDEFSPAYIETLRLRVTAVDDGKPTEIAVVLYDTEILRYRNDETFTVDTGGFATLTTSTRLKQFSPPCYTGWGSSDRNMSCCGFYAEKHLNRFKVSERGIVGERHKAPKLIRRKAKTPHGTLRWFRFEDGFIASVNDRQRNRMCCPFLDFESLPKNGSFNRPFDVNLEIIKGHPADHGGVGISKVHVPLNIVNQHRKMWGMPPIDTVVQDAS